MTSAPDTTAAVSPPKIIPRDPLLEEDSHTIQNCTWVREELYPFLQVVFANLVPVDYTFENEIRWANQEVAEEIVYCPINSP